MRKLFLLLAVSFLLQSCYSYKAMDNDPSKMTEGKRYKIERNHKNYKVTFNRLTDSSIFITRKNFMKEEIPIKDITTIKKRKFSIVKTAGLPLAVVATFTGLVILAYD